MTQLIIECILVALALIACLALFVTLKQEIQRSTRGNRRRIEQMSARLAEACTARALEPVAITSVPPRSGFNLNRRTQALRLLRRGEAVSHVAAAVGVQAREIELLIRVQKMVAAAAGRAPEASAAAAAGASGDTTAAEC
jgi:hypothetical protein